jgi:hypothetical protein
LLSLHFRRWFVRTNIDLTMMTRNMSIKLSRKRSLDAAALKWWHRGVGLVGLEKGSFQF